MKSIPSSFLRITSVLWVITIQLWGEIFEPPITPASLSIYTGCNRSNGQMNVPFNLPLPSPRPLGMAEILITLPPPQGNTKCCFERTRSHSGPIRPEVVRWFYAPESSERFYPAMQSPFHPRWRILSPKANRPVQHFRNRSGSAVNNVWNG